MFRTKHDAMDECCENGFWGVTYHLEILEWKGHPGKTGHINRARH